MTQPNPARLDFFLQYPYNPNMFYKNNTHNNCERRLGAYATEHGVVIMSIICLHKIFIQS